VSEGARTLNPRIHSPVLYQLSYTHRDVFRPLHPGCSSAHLELFLARPEGIEPPTCGFEGRRSIQLSYGRLSRPAPGRREEIRDSSIHPVVKEVGAAGFGPATSCAQGRRATRLRYAPKFAAGPAQPCPRGQ
jgi:hypothetical protein